jgi:hypothetical protein
VKAKPKRDSTDLERAHGQEDQILALLIAAGPTGCVNSQFRAVCHAVNSRISDLRKRGHNITAESEGRGVWRYWLITPPKSTPEPALGYTRPPRSAQRDRLPLFDGVQA